MSNQLTNPKVAFQPVRCTEKQLEAQTPQNGYVYFTTDSQKIYLGTNNDLIPMSGSSGVFYAKKNLTVDQYAYAVEFTKDDFLNNKELPKENDLIINESPSGYSGFYRVIATSAYSVTGTYLGVGGGSGGPGAGPGTSSSGSLIINFSEKTPSRNTIIAGQGYRIYFNIEAKDSAGDLVLNAGKATLKIGEETYPSKTVRNGENYFDIEDAWLDSSVDENIVSIIVSMDVGGEKEIVTSKRWYVTSVRLKLEWDPDYKQGKDYHNKNELFYIKFKAYGGINCIACAKFDDLEIKDKTYFEYSISSKDASGTDTIQWPLTRNEFLTYGSHKCELWLKAYVNGEWYYTPSTFGEITFIGDENRTFLSVPFYQTEATQYDTLVIPYLVYDPDTEVSSVRYLVDDNPVEEDEYGYGLQKWTYTLKRAGAVKLSIETSNGDDRKDFYLNVKELVMEGVTEPTDYTYCLKANDFSTNNQLRQRTDIEFSSNFDWEKGGLQTETLENGDVQKYICVRAGTRMTLKYPLFGSDTTRQNGKNFKFCFKTANCYDYAASVLNCYDSDSGIGVRATAQEAILSTPSFPNFNTQYCENSYIELETEIWPNQADTADRPGDRFLMLWIDGVPVAAKPYGPNETFKQTNAKNIVIGSDECDVYVYTVKVYERSLTTTQHLNNFILDAPSGSAVKDRYERNDILDNNGEISYIKLIQRNPDCHAYVYTIPRMTTSKEDKVSGCDYFELHGIYNTPDNPYYKAVHDKDGVRIRVQGTSSAAYGVAGYNLRTEFQEGLTDKDGQKVDGWCVSDDSIPIDYVCTKVNIASCENANNVVNAEWYNKYQPYIDGHRRKTHPNNKKYRDCMEFNSGVVFIKDNNTNKNYTGSLENYLKANVFSDQEGYVERPYFKMYAIGNMGNDKKNSEVFHDTKNPKACCVEVTDNQNSEHHMTTTVPSDIFVQKYDKDNNKIAMPYEFRYPDGNEEASGEMKQAFIDFVNWMAESNPKAATNEILDAPVDFKPYTFKGFIPPGYSKDDKYDSKSLRGLTISTYATQDSEGNQLSGKTPYTHDTYEYRMAKMLSECEDHLVMDSVVYHYLYIQRHTMVDNVAKNTFWSTEDLIHWDLTKNYDNDTSDGNDNSGNLTYSYGLEILDKDAAGTSIFNAPDSVWLNFIHGLYTAQKDLYSKLVNAPAGEEYGAWDSRGYLKEFEKHQSPIPERCWIDDFFRKYIRPRRLGLDGKGTYIDRLEGGKKVHQRNQFETYQDFYMNSKYVSGPSFAEGSAIDMRLNTDPTGFWDTNYKLPVTFYIDCYASGKIGGNDNYSGQRIKRGETYNFPVGQMIDSAKDSTCYLYGADMVQSLKNIAPVYPSYVKLGGSRRIKELEVGSDASGYRNKNIFSIDAGSNIMLQKLYAQNLGQEQIIDSDDGEIINQEGLGSLDLSNIFQLKELKLNGSHLSSLILPDGAPIELLYLNPLTTLFMSNLNKLNDIRLDEGIYSTLKQIEIKNCEAMNNFSYDLVLRAPLDLGYALNNFVWKIDSGNLDKHFVIENGKVVGIKVLDKLLSKNPISGYTKTTALTGTLIIDIDCNIDEFEIYKKYCSFDDFYNLTIEYTNKVKGLIPAVELKFMSNNSNDASIHYRVLGSGKNKENGGLSIEELTSTAGPSKTELKNPTKGSSDTTIYTFNGHWSHNNTLYYKDGLSNPKPGAKNFKDIVPTESMTFIPQFDETDKTFEIKFYDLDGNVIKQNKNDSFFVPYGITYAAANGPLTNYYYLDSADLADDERYAFQGWSESEYGIGDVRDPVYIDLNTHIVKKALNLHPHYKIESVYTTASNSDYFTYSNDVISLKDSYKGVLQGKITLPSTSPSGTILTKIGNFRDENSKITHIYFLPGCQYTEIQEKAFGTSEAPLRVWGGALEIINLPSTITKLNAQAFYNMQELKSIGENYDNITFIGQDCFNGCKKLVLKELPKNLETLEGHAFYVCENIQVTKLPNNLKLQLGQHNIFGFCDNVRISEFGTNNSGLNIGVLPQGIFYGAGTGTPTAEVPAVNKVTIGSGVKAVGNTCFTNSYASNANSVTFDDWASIKDSSGKTFGTQIELLSYMGLSTNASTVDLMSVEEEGILL